MSAEVCDISEGWDLHLVTFLLQIVEEQSVSGCEMQLGFMETVRSCVWSFLRGHCKVGVPYCKRVLKQCWLSTAHSSVFNRSAFCALYFCVWRCRAQQQQDSKHVHNQVREHGKL